MKKSNEIYGIEKKGSHFAFLGLYRAILNSSIAKFHTVKGRKKLI
jgi:hypothetical protein